jgi:hypothetical protein
MSTEKEVETAKNPADEITKKGKKEDVELTDMRRNCGEWQGAS